MRLYSGKNKHASRRLAVRAAREAILRGDETTFSAVMGKRLARNSDPLRHTPQELTEYVRSSDNWSVLVAR